MAKDALPDFYEKRNVLYNDDVPVERVVEVGRQFMAAEMYDDALEFFERSRSEEDTREVARRAMAQGDTAVWLRAQRILGEEPDEESLRAIAANAEEKGKFMFAIEAWRRLDDSEQIERLRARLAGADAGPADGQA